MSFVNGHLTLKGFQLLTLPSDIHCFEHLNWGQGPGLGHMCWPAAWAVIVDIVEPWSKSDRTLGPWFSLNCQKY